MTSDLLLFLTQDTGDQLSAFSPSHPPWTNSHLGHTGELCTGRTVKQEGEDLFIFCESALQSHVCSAAGEPTGVPVLAFHIPTDKYGCAQLIVRDLVNVNESGSTGVLGMYRCKYAVVPVVGG